jgi:hypothetical protein
MCDAELEAFFMMDRQLPVLIGEDYRKRQEVYEGYVTVLKNWMRGLLDWSARTERYLRVDMDMALQNDELIRRALRRGRQE